jgi:flagella basal body P-ring formation protein FlgA
MRPLPLAAAALAAALASPRGEAATLRGLSTLNAPTVHLSDLFDDAGPNAARVLGPAPSVGGRIVVEAAQLAAIARQFGVAWRPASLADQAVLDRPGRPLPREEVLAAVRAALVRAGASEAAEIELPGFDAPLVPTEGKAQAIATQVDYDAASGRFAALLTVTADTMNPVNLRVAGRLLETMEVAVPAARLHAGSVLRPQDLRLARVRAGLVHGEVVQDPAEVAGMALRHPAAAGQPISRAELVRPPVVEKGATVTMALETQGISLSGQGQALDSGAVGERVRVLNPVSRAVLDAQVTGPGRVRVEPDSAPLVPPGRASVAALR